MASRLDVQAAKSRGNKNLQDRLIRQYWSYIAACASRATGRYLSETDEEMSIALLAFHEALEQYDPEKGSFLTFARGVIHRRLIDHYRKEQRQHRHETPLGSLFPDPAGESYADPLEQTDLLLKQADRFERLQEQADRLEEIEMFSRELADWGISLEELVKSSPKAVKTREAAGRIIAFLIENPDRVMAMKKNRTLPVQEIIKNLGIPRKNTERLRKYIIAAVIILSGDYSLLVHYVKWPLSGRNRI
ncbi:MAG TPA: RNA polymerase sigma-I factor [Clostridiales bacterium]|nr:RNA polymerase sigma-I factor [Clostridiales bacterium]